MIQKAIDILKSSKSVFVLTGAGISAESGVPTFRDADGLWKNYSATDLATPEAFARNPALVWEWYHWRQSIILKAAPNPAHYALVELEKKFSTFLLLTQNVDNLHRRAGSQNVLELHGNIFRARCLSCGNVQEHTIDPDNEVNNLPTCSCSGLLRPDVVWFGEPIPQDVWQQSLTFLNQTDVALISGTSGIVWPAAAIPELAKKGGIKTIEVNLESTPISPIVDISLQGKAGEILPQIVQKL
ncbi:MAG: NAD-dependent deacylase [candidate division WOR-3 bacterium]|nr:MAG: NAD-dependent deacylase [candidate division WOR-3 bacterium]